jgi:hypothetical protein
MNRNLPKSRLNREEAFGELKILPFRRERRELDGKKYRLLLTDFLSDVRQAYRPFRFTGN